VEYLSKMDRKFYTEKLIDIEDGGNIYNNDIVSPLQLKIIYSGNCKRLSVIFLDRIITLMS
jgi:hypothetical protein